MIKKYRVLSSKVETFIEIFINDYRNNINIEKIVSFAQQLIYAGNFMDFTKINDIITNIENFYDDLNVSSCNPYYMDSSDISNEIEVNQFIELIAKENKINLSEESDDEQFNEEKANFEPYIY